MSKESSVDNLVSETFDPSALPTHHRHTRLADWLRAAAMERIPPETKAIYDLLRADFDKVSRECDDTTARAIAQLDAKLDLLSGRLDEVKVSIEVDIDELRQEFDKPAPAADPHGAPAPPSCSAAA